MPEVYGTLGGLRQDVSPGELSAIGQPDRLLSRRAARSAGVGSTSQYEGESKGTNLLDLDASAEKTDGFYDEFAADKDLRVGDLLSGSVDIRATDTRDVYQVAMEFYDATPTLLARFGGQYCVGETTYVRRAVERASVPTGTSKVRLVASFAGFTVPYVLDTYTDADGTAITAHTCESPGGSYTSNFPAGTAVIQDNELKLSTSGGIQARAFTTTDAVGAEGDIEWVFDWTRIAIPLGTHFVHFLARSNSSVGQYDGLGIRIYRFDDTRVQVDAIRGLNGVIQENTSLANNVPVAEGGGKLRFVLSFSGATMTVYYEPWGGGGRTLVGSKTFAASYQDSGHRRCRWVLFGTSLPIDVRVAQVQAPPGTRNEFGFFSGGSPKGSALTTKAMVNRGPVALPFAYPLVDARVMGSLAVGDILRYDGNFFVNSPTASANFAYRDQANVFTAVNTFNADVLASLIRRGTADGSDTESVSISGGGALGAGRGAFITLNGADVAVIGGQAVLEAGGSGHVLIRAGAVNVIECVPASTKLLLGGAALAGESDPIVAQGRLKVYSGFHLATGGLALGQTLSFGANGNLDFGYTQVTANAGTGAITLTIPLSGFASGHQFHVKKIDATANVVTIAATAPATIDGAGSTTLTKPGESLLLADIGGEWKVLWRSGPISAADVAAGTFPSGAFTFQGLVTLAAAGLDTPAATDLLLKRAGTTKLTLANALATFADPVVTGADPGGADQLRVGGALTVNVASPMIRTKTAWTNGAAAQVGTLNNAPAAGDPTKWIPLDDNGTTRYVPAW